MCELEEVIPPSWGGSSAPGLHQWASGEQGGFQAPLATLTRGPCPWTQPEQPYAIALDVETACYSTV